MKLKELKEQTLDAWKGSCSVNGVLIQPENFTNDIKRFGDRRFRKTWIKAMCHYAASLERAASWWCPSVGLVRLFSIDPGKNGYWAEYREELLEALLTLPDGAAFVWEGLQNLTSGSQEEEFLGIFELVEKSARERGLPDRACDGSEQRASFSI